MPEDLFRPQLGGPHHHAYVVEDIEATVTSPGRTARRRTCVLHRERAAGERPLARGEPAEFAHNAAFGSCGGGAIELMQAISLAPERVEKRFAPPRPRIQHVAYVVPPAEVADLRTSLDERGMPQNPGLSVRRSRDDSPLTPPPPWATTSRSTSRTRVCAASSRWWEAPPRGGMVGAAARARGLDRRSVVGRLPARGVRPLLSRPVRVLPRRHGGDVHRFRPRRSGDQASALRRRPALGRRRLGTLVLGVRLALDTYSLFDAWILIALALWFIATFQGIQARFGYQPELAEGPGPPRVTASPPPPSTGCALSWSCCCSST